jgi:2-polyprenyl-6-methoxyphenol hydroxylase-like FAD-dependent oxidoreductase
MAGTWLTQTGITSMIIEKRPFRTQFGHADGIDSRTFEILDSFGIGDEVWKQANRTIDVSIWVGNEPLSLVDSHLTISLPKYKIYRIYRIFPC